MARVWQAPPPGQQSAASAGRLAQLTTPVCGNGEITNDANTTRSTASAAVCSPAKNDSATTPHQRLLNLVADGDSNLQVFAGWAAKKLVRRIYRQCEAASRCRVDRSNHRRLHRRLDAARGPPPGARPTRLDPPRHHHPR